MTVLVFLLGLLLPRGMTEWVLYLAPVFLLTRASNRPVALPLTAALTILIWLGFYLSPPGPIPTPIAIMNAVLGTIVLSAATFVLAARQRAEEARRQATASLSETNTALQAEVAQRRQAVSDLSESERRHRALVEFAPEAVAVHSEGRWVYMNPAGLRLAGVDDPSALFLADRLSILPWKGSGDRAVDLTDLREGIR